MSFQHTTLLECNREQSVQRGVEGDNHAIFTNRMGKVVELDVGDTISVKSAFINKRGSANPNSIEFKGESIGVNVSFRQTATAKESPTTYSLDNRYPTISHRSNDTARAGSVSTKTNPYLASDSLTMAENHGDMSDIAFKQIFTEEVTKDIKDNEMYLETEYYRNADGGNYTFLPRRSKRLSGVDNSHTPPIANYYGGHNPATQYWERCDFDWDLNSGGEIGTVTILSQGADFTTNPPLGNGDVVIPAGSLTTNGNGTEASISLHVELGKVTRVDVISSGHNYREKDSLVVASGIVTPGSSTDPLTLEVGTIADEVIYTKGSNSGICRYQPDLSYSSGLMQNIQNGLLRCMLMEDYHFVGQGITYGPNTAKAPQPQTKATVEYYDEVKSDKTKRNSAKDFASLKPKHDCSRFFLFEREYDWLQQPATIIQNTETGITKELEPFYTFIGTSGIDNVSVETDGVGYTPSTPFLNVGATGGTGAGALFSFDTNADGSVNIDTLIFTVESGAGYKVGDILTLDNVGSATTDATVKVGAVRGSKSKINGENWFENVDLSGGGEIPFDFPNKFRRLPARSPALFPYLRRRDVNHVVLDKGYSTPASISQQITKKCQEQTTNSPYFPSTQNQVDPGPAQSVSQGITNYTTNVETGFYKPIVSSTLKNAGEYFKSTLNNVKAAFSFWKAHHNILIKRPDIYEAGIKINNRLGNVSTFAGQSANPPIDPNNPSDNELSLSIPNVIRNQINFSERLFNNTTDPIVTSWVYTETNLKLLSELFDAQGKHPELFYDESREFNANRPFMNQVYPDFNPAGATPGAKFGNLAYGTPARITNSRFLHMNRFNYFNDLTIFDGGNQFDTLGNDGYVKMSYSTGTGDDERFFDADHRSMAVFFRYMPEFRNIETTGTDITRLSYGFATKTRGIGLDLKTYDFITLHPELVNGIRPEAFVNRGGSRPFTTASEEFEATWDPANMEKEKTMIGWDYHFTSWGNIFMIQQDGLPIQSFDGVTKPSYPIGGIFYNRDPSEFDDTALGFFNNVADLIDQSYIGTNNIACAFDEVSNRFGWEYLHNPIFEGNPEDAGSTDFKFVKEGDNEVPTAQTSVAINPNADSEVYKVNPRPYKWVWNNDLAPYIVQTGVLDSFNQGDTKGRVELNPMNNNFVPWKIYDSQCGVAIDFGKTARINPDNFQLSQEEAWNRSLLGILGFTYEQFNPDIVSSKNNSSARVSTRNLTDLSFPSTNSRPKGTDTNLYVMNEYGAVQYNTQMPYALRVNIIGMDATATDPAEPPRVYNLASASSGTIADPLPWLYLPPVVVKTESIVIEAVSLPRVALFPYMTIRSDIITPQKYIGGRNSGLSLPVISVVNKINADKDYIQMEGSSDTFMVTEPSSFSSITTAIMDPDGSLSLLDEGSAVIYKITKADNLSRYNIVAEFEKLLNKK